MATLEHDSKISASTDQPSLTTMVHCIRGIANELQYYNLPNFTMYFMCTAWCHFMDKQTHQKLYRSHQSREKSIANGLGHLDILWTQALPIHEARLQWRLLRIKQIVFCLLPFVLEDDHSAKGNMVMPPPFQSGSSFSCFVQMWVPMFWSVSNSLNWNIWLKSCKIIYSRNYGTWSLVRIESHNKCIKAVNRSLCFQKRDCTSYLTIFRVILRHQ